MSHWSKDAVIQQAEDIAVNDMNLLEHFTFVIEHKLLDNGELNRLFLDEWWKDRLINIVAAELVEQLKEKIKMELTKEELQELFEGAPNQDPTLEELETRVCACGEPIEKCPDAYEHITHGV